MNKIDKNRKTAYSVLWDMEQKNAYSNLALNQHIRRELPDNPAFVRELVYGVLENRMLLDSRIRPFLRESAKHLGRAEKILLRMGFWQLGFSDTIPAFAAVNETVNLAKSVARGREGFINAVLRNYLRKRETEPDVLPEDPETRYSCQKWIVDKWTREYGWEKTLSMLAASLGTPSLTIRPNPTKTDKDALALRLNEKGFAVSAETLAENCLSVKGGNLLETEEYRNGLFSVQEDASVYAVEILDPKPGETVIDVCAAPGGKSLAIWEKMGGEGNLISCDISAPKLRQISREARRLGLPKPRIVVRNAVTGIADDDAVFPLESADRVLADCPCSGLGMLARKPEIKLREPDPGLGLLPEKQLSILKKSAELVKKGGTLVYSTCTVSKTENEELVRTFLSEEGEWTLGREIVLLPEKESTDGFYIAELRRAL